MSSNKVGKRNGEMPVIPAAAPVNFDCLNTFEAKRRMQKTLVMIRLLNVRRPFAFRRQIYLDFH